ncbi:MAG: hypothetical protein IID33_10420 [Planctomycetes bacterium]|nr:hypothetical protein [Planctomycetota bacterium]
MAGDLEPDAGGQGPFTGEGIACALAGGHAVAPLALCGMERWDASLEREWTLLHRQLVVRRQFICRLMSALLRRPAAMQLLIAALAALPALAAPFIERLNAPGYDRGAVQT